MPRITDDQKRQILFTATRRDGQSTRRAINKLIDAKCGKNASRAIDLAIAVMDGTLVARARAPNQGEDQQTYAALVPLVHPSIQQRLEAAKFIIEQRNGKASPAANPTLNLGANGEASLSVPIELDKLGDAEIDIFEHLLTKVQPTNAPGLPQGDEEDADYEEIENVNP